MTEPRDTSRPDPAATTLVLCAPGAREGARALLPKLPDACFADFAGPGEPGAALRGAGERGLRQAILVGRAGDLAAQAAAEDPARPLAEVTREMTGREDVAVDVAAAATAGEAYALWEKAGIVGQCGRELCRRAAEVLERFAEGAVAVQVVLVDAGGRKMVGMYGRLAR